MTEEELLSNLLKKEMAKQSTASTTTATPSSSAVKRRSRTVISHRQFEHGRAAVSDFAGISLWLLMWLINGYFTVVYLNALGDTLISKEYSMLINGGVHLVGNILAATATGWIIHTIGSLVEGASWQSLRRGVGLTFIIVALADIVTTTFGIIEIIAAQGISMTLIVVIIIAVIAILLALIPEMMIVKHLQRLGIIGEKYA
jgi:hypothetical protein